MFVAAEACWSELVWRPEDACAGKAALPFWRRGVGYVETTGWRRPTWHRWEGAQGLSETGLNCELVKC